MKAPVRIRKLEAEEYAALKKWAASRKMAAGRVKRAQIILLSNQGYIASEIAQTLDMCEKTVRVWISRFNRSGLAGLEEKVRNGRPPVYSAEEVSTVLALAQTPPQSLDLPFHFWTLDRLVAYLNDEKHIGIKRSRLSEIFLHEGLRWKHEEGWMGERVDPDFAKKKGVIERLYLDPPADSVVVCIDEMGPKAPHTYPGSRWSRRFTRPHYEADYGHRGSGGYIFGALQPRTGEALTYPYTRRTIANFTEFLAQIETWIDPKTERIYAIMDNLRTHRAYDVLLFSLAHPRWEFVFQPIKAPYLNLIEPWWKAHHSLAFAGGRFNSWAEMEIASRKATDYWNQHKHPFVWGTRKRHRARRRLGLATTPLQTQLTG